MRIALTGRTALVTGSNVGIGRGIALVLAESGADVAVTFLTHGADDTVQAIQSLGREGLSVRMDATDSAEVNRAVSSVAERLGGHIDILVNNAGGLVGGAPIAEMSDELWRHVMDVNVTSAFYCIRAVLATLCRRFHLPDLAACAHGRSTSPLLKPEDEREATSQPSTVVFDALTGR